MLIVRACATNVKVNKLQLSEGEWNVRWKSPFQLWNVWWICVMLDKISHERKLTHTLAHLIVCIVFWYRFFANKKNNPKSQYHITKLMPPDVFRNRCIWPTIANEKESKENLILWHIIVSSSPSWQSSILFPMPFHIPQYATYTYREIRMRTFVPCARCCCCVECFDKRQAKQESCFRVW